MKSAKTIVLLSLLSVWGAPAQAQSPVDKPTTFEECMSLFEQVGGLQTGDKADRISEQLARRLPLGVTSVAPTATTAVSLVASDKDGRGLISLATPSSDGDIQNSFSLQVSAPFSSSDNQAVFASLNGLSGDINLSGSFSQFRWNLSPNSYAAKLCQACADHKVSLKECNPEDLAGKIKEQDINAIRDALFTTSIVWGGDFSVGRKERSFFDANAAKMSENRTGYSAAVHGGALFNSWSLYGKVTGKRDYKENDKATLCSPINGSVLQSCTTLPFGEAKAIDSLVAGLEARFFFPTFALAPSAQYDQKADVWGLELPIFLVRNAKGAFTGGVKFGWRSDKHQVNAAVFVTKDLQP